MVSLTTTDSNRKNKYGATAPIFMNENNFKYSETYEVNGEVWCNILGTIYAVSENGNVRNRETNHILAISINDKGYHQISLYIDRLRFQTEVHRLVAEAFVIKPFSTVKLTVDHKNNDKLYNHKDNLEWLSLRDNLQKSSRARGGGSLSATDVINAIERYINNENCTTIARDLGVDGGTIRRIMRLQNWKDVSMPFRETLKTLPIYQRYICS